MHLKDPHANWEMIQALEGRFRVEECSFNTIFGAFEGHRIYASRKVAEMFEIQTSYTAELTMWTSGKISAIWPRRPIWRLSGITIHPLALFLQTSLNRIRGVDSTVLQSRSMKMMMQGRR